MAAHPELQDLISPRHRPKRPRANSGNAWSVFAEGESPPLKAHRYVGYRGGRSVAHDNPRSPREPSFFRAANDASAMWATARRPGALLPTAP